MSMNNKFSLQVNGTLPEAWQSLFSPDRPLAGLGARTLNAVPRFLGALLVFVVGWLIANTLGKLVGKALEAIGLNRLFEKTGWKKAFRKAEIDVDIAEFLGAIVKWTIAFVFLSLAVEILGLYQFASFLSGILLYIPNILMAILIFVVAVVIADILEKIVVASVERLQVGYAGLAGMIMRWAILGFALLAIMVQLGIAPELTLIFFQGVIGFFALSLGLAFGLGGKDIAGEALKNIKKRLK